MGGRNCKEMQWTVMYDRDAKPIDIKLHVQEHKLHSNEVSIECDGQPIFHGAGAHAKAKMTDDFIYQWPFRGTIRGINEASFFEYHPAMAHESVWLPATITAQREDGLFEVLAKHQDELGGWSEVRYPAVDKKDLREAASQKPIAVPENFLQLEVPKQNPLGAVLSMNGGELVTHHFGKPSPKPLPEGQEKPMVTFKVNKERSLVTANVGHTVLSQFGSGAPQAVTMDAERLRHSWTISLGPFAEHKIEIAKKHTMGKILTLSVDDGIFVECSGADIGSTGHSWECKFKFIGEEVMDFEVYKTNKDGNPLDSTDHVEERRKYVKECIVSVPNDHDLTQARLIVDGFHFNELPMKIGQSTPHEAKLELDPRAMMQSYGITVPYKVDESAPTGFSVMVAGFSGDTARNYCPLFSSCYDSKSVVRD